MDLAAIFLTGKTADGDALSAGIAGSMQYQPVQIKRRLSAVIY
jgi:hypothetical protein